MRRERARDRGLAILRDAQLHGKWRGPAAGEQAGWLAKLGTTCHEPEDLAV